jgi:hypothetical protein
MHFELPTDDQKELEPLREELEQTGIDWKMPLDKFEHLVEGNHDLENMLEDLFEQCLVYTKTVLSERKTLLNDGPGEDYAEKDKMRNITHTATQDTIRAFFRNLKKYGKDSNDVYTLMPKVESRAACGKFAVLLTLSRY